MTAVGFEPTPFRTSALNWRLRPLGQTVCYYVDTGGSLLVVALEKRTDFSLVKASEEGFKAHKEILT